MEARLICVVFVCVLCGEKERTEREKGVIGLCMFKCGWRGREGNVGYRVRVPCELVDERARAAVLLCRLDLCEVWLHRIHVIVRWYFYV